MRSVSLLSVPMKFILLFCISLNTTKKINTSTTGRFTDVVRQEMSFDLCRNQNIKFSNLHNLHYERYLTNSEQTSLSQRHTIGNITIIANLVFLIHVCLQFPFLFVPNDVGKCETRYLWENRITF